mmetsp:Transcript_53524/g.148422  ORF Transcript_53524/g.148422 Transcript_53524/m.148422 type:complete len:245 (+) Transcript_53524:1-735(+)
MRLCTRTYKPDHCSGQPKLAPWPSKLSLPNASCPQGLGRRFVAAEEDEASDGDPHHPRGDAREERQRPLFRRDGPHGADRAHILGCLAFHGLLQHEPCLGHIEGRGGCSRDCAGYGAAGRALHRIGLAALPSGPHDFQPLVDRELDEGKRDLSHHQGAVAHVEAADPAAGIGGSHCLRKARVLAHLQALRDDLRRHADQAGGYFAARGSRRMVPPEFLAAGNAFQHLLHGLVCGEEGRSTGGGA